MALSPTTYAADCATPTLLIQHEQDLRTPPANSGIFYTLLKMAGSPVEMLRMTATSHTGSIEPGSAATRRARNEAVLDWFRRYLP